MQLLNIAENVWIDPEEISIIAPAPRPTEFGSGSTVKVTMKSGESIVLGATRSSASANSLIRELVAKIASFETKVAE